MPKFELSYAQRDVLVSLLQGAKDDVGRQLAVVRTPGANLRQSVELFRGVLDVYAKLEDALRPERSENRRHSYNVVHLAVNRFPRETQMTPVEANSPHAALCLFVNSRENALRFVACIVDGGLDLIHYTKEQLLHD